MKTCHTTALCLTALLMASPVSSAQSKRSGPAPTTRYFQLTLNMKSGAVADEQSSTQAITSEVAVRSDKPGSCKARMTFQVPISASTGTKYIELGTKLDCNDVHIEGDGIALQFALETSRVVQMIQTKNSAGVAMEEPLIGQRAVQLTVKLPLDQVKVVFDSRSKPLQPPSTKSSTGGAVPSASPTAIPIPSSQDLPMLIELIARELK